MRLLMLLTLVLLLVSAGGARDHGSVYISHQTHYHGDGVSGGEAYQDWHVQYGSNRCRGQSCSGSPDGNVDQIVISTSDGSTTESSGQNYRIWTDDYSWLNGGDNVCVYFKDGSFNSQEKCRTMPIPNEPPNTPSNPDPAEATDTSPVATISPTLQVDVSDPDGDQLDVTFYDSSNDNVIDSKDDVSSGSNVETEWSGLTGGQSYDWYVEACDPKGECTTSPIWSFEVNRPPNEATEPDPSGGETIYDSSTELSVRVSDPDGDSLTVEFSNNVSNPPQEERTVTVSSGSEATISLDDLERGKFYEWDVEISDDYYTTESGSWNFYVNSIPTLTGIEPDENAIHTSDQVILNATFSQNDEEDEPRVFFYNSTGDLIGKDRGPATEKLSSDPWKGLNLGNTYQWHFNVSDGSENRSHGPFEFTRSATRIFRVDQRVTMRYSSIISSIGSSNSFILEVENRVSTPKQMRTQLRNVNAYFDQTGQDEIEYSLDSFETKEFLVIVQPENTGRRNLEIISENRNIDLNTTDKVPVLVREVESVSDARNVPGINLFQILFIVLVSSYLYSVRL